MSTDPNATRVLVTGAAGVLGRALLRRPAAGGYAVRGAGRSASGPGGGWARMDLATGEGVAEAVRGVDAVVHAASSPRGDTRRVDVEGTARLLDAARAAGVRHLVYVSIVGVDRIPFPYYRLKWEAERAVAAGGVPWTVLRGTQFHDFVDTLVAGMMRPPVGIVPRGFRAQPVDVDEFADAVWACVAAGPAGRAPDVAGPEVLTYAAMAEAWKAARGVRKPVLQLPLPGAFAAAMRAGHATAPDRAVGRVAWAEWLRARGTPLP